MTHRLSLCDTGAQYSALTEHSDTDHISEEESLPEERPCHYNDTACRYTEIPQDRNRTSTPIPFTHVTRERLEAIIHHQPAFQIPPVDIVVAPGQGANNQVINLGTQRVQAIQGMAAGAGRRGQNAQQQQLQGADPTLVKILQLMNNRDANRDNAKKKFLMFPKETFTDKDKKLSQGHWAEFAKYLDYQASQGIIQRDNAHINEIKSMFRLTLQDIDGSIQRGQRTP